MVTALLQQQKLSGVGGIVTPEDVMSMAREVWSAGEVYIGPNTHSLERFAELVAAAEREACCSIVYGQCGSDNVAQRTVDAIRARGAVEQ